MSAADRAHVPVVVERLERDTGIRHALALCGERDIYSAYVPTVDSHPGEQLRENIAHDEIAVYEQRGERDAIDEAVDSARGARAVVMGFGGLTVRGRKLTNPDELPNSVLDLADGRLAHVLLQEISTDLVIVCDHIDVRHGRVARGAAVGGAVGAIAAGGVVGGVVGLGAVIAALGVAAVGFVAATDTD